MIQIAFIVTIILVLTLLFRWAFRELPAEKWQILGVIPAAKQTDGKWQGVNLTFYGFFIATASVFATMMVYILLGAIQIPAHVTTLIFVAIFGVSVPSAKILARIVEKKSHTASVGGASFVGIVLAPWLILLFRTFYGFWAEMPLPVIPILTAFIIAYAFGEGLGRLACISFGCCYGRPMKDLPEFFRKIAGFRPMIYHGATKKIVYADHLEGVEVFPIQAVTSVIYCGSGLIGTLLYLNGIFAPAFLLILAVTQFWRFASEFLRADFRGTLKISVYQIMALLTIPYGLLLTRILPSVSTGGIIDLTGGFHVFASPLLLIFLQLIWVVMFWSSGRSYTTGSTLRFHVNHNHI